MSESGLTEEEKAELSQLIDSNDTSHRPRQQSEGKQEKHRDLEFKFEEPGHDFSDVVGMQWLKKQVREKIREPIENREMYEKYGIENCVNGVLFYGPPRVGKTFLTEGFAGECGYNFLHVNSADIVDPKVGVSEKNIKQLVSQAVQFQPCIVLIDEVESLSSDRGGETQSYKKDFVSVFLNEMENLTGEDAVVVGTTNHVDRVDEAFLQKGRFSEMFFVGLPGEEMRKELVVQGLENADSEVVDDVDVERVADLCEGLNCGDILEGVVYEAKLKALKRGESIGTRHLIYGVEQTDRSVVDQEKYRL